MKNLRHRAPLIKEARAKIATLKAEIKVDDLWFISNMSSKDWTKRIDAYWVRKAKLEDLQDRVEDLMLNRSAPDYSTYHTINTPQI